MKATLLDLNWTFRRGYLDSPEQLSEPGTEVNLPHDGMIGTPVSPDAPAGVDSGYFGGGLTSYTRVLSLPAEGTGDCIGLQIDGAMMNATVDINGSRVGQCHYGYAPFFVDLTDHVLWGSDNRITINLNTAMQPASRWYTGSGLYRGVKLLQGPRVHIVPDGICLTTRSLSDTHAFLEGTVDIENAGLTNRMAEVTLELLSEGTEDVAAVTKRVVELPHGEVQSARMTMVVPEPKLWDADHPNLYLVRASVRDLGDYRTHFVPEENGTTDTAEVLFGIRTITADPVRGLQVNGRTVKLKGGCLHHDNGLLGAVSLLEIEMRKVRRLKEIGFNAIRTAHNPPSAALIEACDRVGMYVFDEAFDAWLSGKRGGDYHQHFLTDWEKDLTAFVKRDRTHPSVLLWSTGNEITERGGLSQGYTVATRLAETIRRLDPSRPISNGICSLWSGLDDALAAGQNASQNAAGDADSLLWEHVTEPFTNGLDVVGYNYLEDLYEQDHELYPERVMLGSECFPKEIGFRWPLVERLPYVIGDFTWTAWDYIGEAGIGKTAYVDPEDKNAPQNPWDLMAWATSPYPWRLANDADIDITGIRRPQGDYRSVIWGSDATHLYSMHPDTYGKKEVVSMWGFPGVRRDWNYEGREGAPIELVVLSSAEEVEIRINDRSVGRKPVSKDRPLPCSVRFDTVYEPGEVIAISYRGGEEVSRDTLVTTGKPAQITLHPEKETLRADGHDAVCVEIRVLDAEGRTVPNAQVPLRAELTGTGFLAAFGSAEPITEEDYTDDKATTCRGCAQAILRAGYEAGSCTLTVSAEGLPTATVTIAIGE